jgi:hypothetical protein
MSRELISKKTRNEFREYLVKWTLQEIAAEFDAVGIDCTTDYSPPESGQRRSLVEQYYHTLDFTNQSDVKKLLTAYGNILKTELNRAMGIDEKIAERIRLEVDKLAGWLKRDGFIFNEAKGEITPISKGINLDDKELKAKREISHEAEKRIWEEGLYRIFLSHKVEVKKEVAELKRRLKIFSASCFVAHEDIHPTQEWQDEIENALFSMDAFVALLTEGFHDSLWTDQEVGVAFGRGVPIISVKLGKNPYGFIGKFQALSCSWDTAAKEIVKILVKHDQMLNAYIKAVENCSSYDQGNTLSEILPSIDKLSKQQVTLLISVFNENGEVRGSFGFNGKNSRYYGEGLLSHLNRITGKTHRLSQIGKIEVI